MSRKTVAMIAVGIFCMTIFALAVPAQGVKNFVVLPFDYVGPEKYQHYGKSVRSVLRNKLNNPGIFEPASDSAAAQFGNNAPETEAAAVNQLNALDLDYIIYGVVSVAGETASIEVNARGRSGNLLRKSSEVPHDQLSLELNKLARQVNNELFDTPTGENQPKEIGTTTANPTFLAAQPAANSDPAKSINPEFRYEGGSQNAGRWQSQGLRFASRGMVICDGDGDGNNEVFILGVHKLFAYQYKEERLEPLAEMRFANRLKPLHLSTIDSNRDGRYELVVTYVTDSGPLSYVYEYANGKFTTKVERSNHFLNVIRMPPNYSPMLVAQRLSHLGGFRSTDAMEAYISKGKILPGRGIRLPQFGNIYNVAFLPEEESYKIVMLDNFNRLKVFTDELEADYMSQEGYNSAAVPISLGHAAVPGLDTTRDVIEEAFYYVPITMRTTNLFSEGNKWELLLNKDVSVASQLFARFKSFTQGELHAMYWDGTGLNLAWKTRRIKGTVIDYDIVDVNNDGRLNLAVLVNTYPGAIAVANIKTVLFAYELNL